MRRGATASLALTILLAAAAPARAGDPVKGKQVFSQMCAVCHSAAKGGGAMIGPPLYGVVDRPAASIKGFSYSTAMKTSGLTWSDAELHTYLPAPAKTVPGTKMTFAGLKNPVQVDDVVAYLDTLK
jgi:cytochrome c